MDDVDGVVVSILYIVACTITVVIPIERFMVGGGFFWGHMDTI